MPGSTAVSTGCAPSPSRPKRAFAEVDYFPASSSAAAAETNTSTVSHHRPHRKKPRNGPAPSTIPSSLPMQPHEALLHELQDRYSIATASVISSSKINKKVTSVLSHLGHVDLFSAASKPGVVMLHARAGDASKMVTVMELAKRRMCEAGHAWYQYNRVYDVAKEQPKGGGGSRTAVEDTAMGEDEDVVDDDDDDAFEPVESPFEKAIRERPVNEKKTVYMSMFLSRVPMPELQNKSFFTLQTNADETGRRRPARDMKT